MARKSRQVQSAALLLAPRTLVFKSETWRELIARELVVAGIDGNRARNVARTVIREIVSCPADITEPPY